MTVLAADVVRNFGVVPKAALMSPFAASAAATAIVPGRCGRALALVRERAPELEVDGEMHPDTALVPSLRERMLGGSQLDGVANLLVMPNLDAANISVQPVEGRRLMGCRSGRSCSGMSKPIHVVVPNVTARGIVNVSAVAAQEAQLLASGHADMTVG